MTANRAEGYCDSAKTKQLAKELAEYDERLAGLQVEIDKLDDDGDENKAARRLTELRGKIELIQRRRSKNHAALVESEKADAKHNLESAQKVCETATKAFSKARDDYAAKVKKEYKWPQAGDLMLVENWPISLSNLRQARGVATEALHRAEAWLCAVDPTTAPAGIRFTATNPGEVIAEKIGG
jgi:hypothetical protein